VEREADHKERGRGFIASDANRDKSRPFLIASKNDFYEAI
jgi:hypothetical protein